MSVEIGVQLAYLLSATLFVFGLKRMGSPATARAGNQLASLAMLVAVVATLVQIGATDWSMIALGIVVGSILGAILARTVKMTSMPELVGAFNGFGGAASAVVAGGEFYRLLSTGSLPLTEGATIFVSTLIGAVTFSGSFVAFGKLNGTLPGRPLTFPLQKTVSLLLLVGLIAVSVMQIHGSASSMGFLLIVGGSLLLGILLVIPIGGADMPVVVSLLNSYSGLAASAAGFAIGNTILILAGALVGAAGLILTNQMCRAMNRSLANVAFGAFGTDSATAKLKTGERPVKDVDAEQAALVLAYADSVVIVPGYGLAVAQAQHELRKVADLLGERGVDVRYAIHPVAGRMPGHMNVLLAEADVPYDKLFDLDEINDDFRQTDVVLVVGANDVVNPAARDPESVIAGMPILDVDYARNVIVMKRSLSPGFAGIDNDLFYMEHTRMFFGDAKNSMSDLVREVREA